MTIVEEEPCGNDPNDDRAKRSVEPKVEVERRLCQRMTRNMR
jgi:hypothetical protein